MPILSSTLYAHYSIASSSSLLGCHIVPIILECPHHTRHHIRHAPAIHTAHTRPPHRQTAAAIHNTSHHLLLVIIPCSTTELLSRSTIELLSRSTIESLSRFTIEPLLPFIEATSPLPSYGVHIPRCITIFSLFFPSLYYSTYHTGWLVFTHAPGPTLTVVAPLDAWEIAPRGSRPHLTDIGPYALAFSALD